MKKLFAILLILVLTFCFASCSSQVKSVNSENITTNKQATNKQQQKKLSDRSLKVIIKDERTAQFRLYDPNFKSIYQVGQNLTYNWEIKFDKFMVYTRTPYVDNLKTVTFSEMSHGFSKSGGGILIIENGENFSEEAFSVEFKDNTLI